MNRRSIFTVLLFFTFSISTLGQSKSQGIPFITNFTPETYNAHIQNWDIAQDSRGVIYIANVDGLLEYDGENWELYPLPDETTVRSIDIDEEDRIYTGTSRSFGYFEPDEKGKLQFSSLTHKLPKPIEFGDIWSTSLLDDKVFFRSYYYIFVYQNDTIKTFRASQNSRFSSDFVYKGNYYVRDLNKGILKYQNDTIQTCEFTTALKDYYPSGISDKKSGEIVFLSEQSLYYLKDGRVQTYNKDLNDLLSKADTYFGLEIVGEKIAIGTTNEGVVIYDPNTGNYQVVNEKKGLQGETVYELLVDRQENLWLALSNGISRIENNSPFTYWNEIYGLNAFITDIFEYNGVIYLTTENGVYYLTDNELGKIEGLNEQSWSFLLFEPSDGSEPQLLTGTNAGLVEIRNFNLINHYNKPTLVVSTLYQTPDFPGLVFLGLTDGLAVLKYENGKWKELFFKNELGYDIRSIACDDKNIFWLGTFRSGVVKAQFDPQSHKISIIKNYRKEKGFPSLKNVNVFSLSDKLVFTTEAGVFQYHESSDRFIPDSTFGEVYADGVYGAFDLVEVDDSTLWITGLNLKESPLGLGKMDKQGIFEWDFELFKRLPRMMVFSLYSEGDSVLWIGGSKGLFRYENKDYNMGAGLQTLIRKVTLEGDSIIYFGNQTLNERMQNTQVITNESGFSYAYNNITFTFALPFFDAQNANSYQYYLEGFDKHWSDWQNSNFKQYTNLPPGDYIFHVKGKNVYGKEGAEAIYKFTITPPWYLTYWAFLGYLLLMVSLVYLIIRIYTFNLKATNIKLERKVQERTLEIEQQKEEIEQQRDSIYNQARQLELINQELKKLSIAARETDNAIIVMDTNGNIEWINEGFTRLYGYNIEELKDKMNGNIITGSSNSKMSEIFQQVKKEKKSYIYESSLRAKNGEKIVTQTTLTPITDEFDRVYRLVAIDSDIRKLKHVENELQKLNATKDKFFSIIAHDLKNPFHSLLAATQTLRMKIKDYDKEKILFFLENMESVARRGYDLLVNLLEWSRSQTGRLDFKPEKTNLHQLVKNSVDLLKGAAENKGVKLENAVDNDIEVLVDRNTIATVLRNLISNGIKYTLKDDRVKIYAKREESTVFVYVEDTGTGIKKEHVAKLFRLDKNISTRGTQDETGTGLGLILCKEFVERNGGTIFVESTEGEGSTFYFTIPLADQG